MSLLLQLGLRWAANYGSLENSLKPTLASKASDVALKSAARLVLPPDWDACRYWDP